MHASDSVWLMNSLAAWITVLALGCSERTPEGGAGAGGTGSPTGSGGSESTGAGGTESSTGGAGGSGGAGGGSGACLEPVSCPGVDRNEKPVITCVEPNEATAGTPFVLHLFGTHLQEENGLDTKIAFSGDPVAGGNVRNGVPVSPCHLTVDIDAGFFAGPGQVEIAAITGVQSDPATLTLK